MDKLYSVEDLAHACNVTARAVRLYVDKGLLEPRRAGRTMVFTEVSIQKLGIIQRCKRLGLSLNEISERLHLKTEHDLQDMISRMEDITLDATTELQVLSEQLSDLRKRKELNP